MGAETITAPWSTTTVEPFATERWLAGADGAHPGCGRGVERENWAHDFRDHEQPGGRRTLLYCTRCGVVVPLWEDV